MIPIQKQLCNILQNGIPICEKPFAKIAEELSTNEKTVIEQICQLKEDGIIRRFRAIINHRALGKSSTLVAAHVTEDKINDVAEAINALPGVSHNYLREHFYNLWFTLQAQAEKEIEHILSDLKERFGIDFHSMPVVRTFKLNVQFDIADEKQSQTVSKPKSKAVVLSDSEKTILSKLQKELEITERPFSFLMDEKLSVENALKIISKLIEQGVIRRIAAVINYHQLGFNANALFACEVPEERIIETGEKLAIMDIVSHCYERKTFDGWPYNLFAMMHGRNMDEIKNKVNKFIKAEKIKSCQLLPTTLELKKEPVKYIVQ